MILGSLQTLTTVDMSSPEVTENSSVSNVDILALLPNPDFDSEPNIVVNGSSTEFSGIVMDVAGDMDRYVGLNWNHTANTMLDYVGQDPYATIPDYNDFIYVYQEFDWLYNERPSDAEVCLNFSTYRTGDFAEGAQDGNNLMFRVYVWAIDSSGNWVKIYESREAVYAEAFQMRRIDLNYFTLNEVFQGMIEVDGVQEDPEDTVQLAIGLAPTWRFNSYNETEPWTYYNGEVRVSVTFCDIYAYMETEVDPSSIWQPEYNVTYGTMVREEFPNSINASLEVRNQCYGMIVGEDGSVYVTGNTISPYELYISDGIRFSNQFLLKYSPTLGLQWAVKNDNNTQVRSMTFHDGFIYTTGYIYEEDAIDRNMIVTKWSSSGVKVWESEWGGDFRQVGVGVAVHENGSVYVVVSDYDMMGSPGYQNETLLKFDENGNLLWEKPQGMLPLIRDVRGDLYLQGDYLYLMQAYAISIMNLEGEYVAGVPSQAGIPDGNNGFYTATMDLNYEVEDGTRIVLYHRDATGNTIWNTTYVRQWSNGRYMNYMPTSMTITPDDELLLLAVSYTLNYEFILLTYDTQGNLLGNRTIMGKSWPAHYETVVFMDTGIGGLGYFAFDIFEESIDINIQAFIVYEAPGVFTLTVAMVIMITSTLVIIGAGVGILRWKRRNP